MLHMQMEKKTAAQEVRVPPPKTLSPSTANASPEPLGTNSGARSASQTYGISDNLLNLSVPQFLICKMRIPNSTYHIGLARRCKMS